jgi:hypothetical protein
MNDGYRKPFIPGWLDDAELTPVVFRVYCRISRRGVCNESLRHLAKGCRIKRRTAQTAIQLLVAKGMVSEEKRFGRTTIYRVGPSPFGVLGHNGTQSYRGTTPQAPRGTRDPVPQTDYKGIPNKVSPGKESPPVSGDALKELKPAERITAERELERVRESITRVRECAGRDAFGTYHYTPQERTKLKTLKDRESVLMKTLGVVA